MSEASRRDVTPGRPRPSARGTATRELLLTTAEELFADHGIASVALRDIGSAAGQRNNIAVQYHFGDREALADAIAEYRSTVTDELRTTRLADLLAGERPPDVRDLVAAFVEPLSVHFEPGNHYLAYLSRYISERDGYTAFNRMQAASTVNTIGRLLHRFLPDCPDALFQERWHRTMTTTVHTLARYQALAKLGELSAPLDVLIDDLVTFLTASLLAPVERDADAPVRLAGSRPAS